MLPSEAVKGREKGREKRGRGRKGKQGREWTHIRVYN